MTVPHRREETVGRRVGRVKLSKKQKRVNELVIRSSQHRPKNERLGACAVIYLYVDQRCTTIRGRQRVDRHIDTAPESTVHQSEHAVC